ncbi:MAG: hypothetical protein CSA13_00770 [Clostridiales bacterium]|nr:MAG: hypothetical protein CSA13_00770 [Clostridiales bacterium]
MITLLFVMTRQLLSDSLIDILARTGNYTCHSETIYSNAPIAARCYDASVVVIEIATSDTAILQEKFSTFKKIRRAAPNCKLLVICSEDESALQSAVIDAKRSRLIDDFVFINSGVDDLIARIEALL